MLTKKTGIRILGQMPSAIKLAPWVHEISWHEGAGPCTVGPRRIHFLLI